VLNRLFIAIGVLVILAIGAAFIVPRFIQWGDYRERLETMAAEAFGTEVAIPFTFCETAVAINDGHRDALGTQCQRNVASDVSTCTGHDCDFASRHFEHPSRASVVE